MILTAGYENHINLTSLDFKNLVLAVIRKTTTAESCADIVA